MPLPPLAMLLGPYGPTPCDFGQGMRVQFDITVQGDPAVVSGVVVSVSILDSSGGVFRRLSQEVELDGDGRCRVFLIWDGTDGQGHLTPPGRDYGPTFAVSGRLADGSRVDVVQQFCSGISAVDSRRAALPGSLAGVGRDLGGRSSAIDPPPLNCFLTPWADACRNEVIGWWPPRPPVPRPQVPDQVGPGPGVGPPPVTGGGGVQPPVVVGPGGDPPPFDPRPRSPRPVVVAPGSASGDGAPGSACPIR